MINYHVNSITGNPGKCSATVGTCPYGSSHEHYATKDEAYAAYEANQSSFTTLVKPRKMSSGTKVLLELDTLQRKLKELEPFFKDSSNVEVRIRANAIIERRNSLQEKLKALPWDETDAAHYDETELTIRVKTFPKNKIRQGYSNDWWTASDEEQKIYDQLDHASQIWASRLSSAEVKAVVLYNFDAKVYAEIMAGIRKPSDEERLFLKNLHSALAKAPRVKTPYVAFAGISGERQELVCSQAEKGTIDMGRLQSASLNPAQVNGFTHWNDEEAVTIEVELLTIASLTAFNIHTGEMEVLIPPGKYSISDKMHNVFYAWGKSNENKSSDKLFGKTVGTVYVSKLEDVQ
jgi:hypothetical protein